MRGATYNIHGARLRVESDDGPALRSLMRLLDGFPQVAETLASGPGAGMPGDAGGACLSLRFGPRALAPPESAVRLFRHGEVRALGERGRLWLTDGWSRLCVDALAGRAEGEAHPASWTREPEFEAYFLRLGLLELLRGQGRFPLEAAVLTAGKIAVLAAGGLDRGRARAAAWCLEGPAPSGEVALLRLGPHGVLAGEWSPDLHPAPSEYPAPFSLSSSARPGPPPLPSPARGGRMECRPQLLLFAFEMPGATRVEPMLEREALAALIPASPLLLTNPLLAPAHLETLRVLVRQCRCYRLLHGPDLFRRPQAMGDLIGALAAV